MSKGSSWGKKKKRQLKRAIGNCCYEGCTQTKKLQFAHLQPTGLSGRSRGLNRRIKDVLEHLDKYSLLCKYHHDLFDKGLI